VIDAQRRASCVKARLHYELVRIGNARKWKWRFAFHPRRVFLARVRELSSNFGAGDRRTLLRMALEKFGALIADRRLL
jgi:hypothetical protein